MSDFVTLISALAWPAAALAISVLFRRELRMALGRLGQVKYGAMEMTFREDLRQAEALAQARSPRVEAKSAAPAPAKVQFEAASGDGAELAGTMVGGDDLTATSVVLADAGGREPHAGRDLASYLQACQESPRAGVLDAWDDLEQALIRAATRLGDRRQTGPVRIESALRLLVDRGWLATVEGQLVERVRRLSEAVGRLEGPPLTLDEARRIVKIAVPLIDRAAALA